MAEVLYGNTFAKNLYEEIKALARGDETDLMINEDGKVWVQNSKGVMELVREGFDCQKIISFGSLLASHYDLELNGKHPFLDCQVPFDGARIHINLPPSTDKPTLSLRFHKTHFRDLNTLQETGMFSAEQKELLIKYVKEKKNIIINGETGCHGKGTLILMANGELKKVEDIKVGELVMGDDGTPRKVLELHRGQDIMYKITPTRKAEPFIVNKGHILALIRSGKDNLNFPPYKEKALEEYLNESNNFKRHYILYKGKVENFYKDKEENFPFPPYILGCLLSHGTVAKSKKGEPQTLYFSYKKDSKVYEELDKFFTTLGCTIAPWHNYTLSVNSPKRAVYIDLLKELGLENMQSENKFIPFRYKTGTLQERKEMLAGLLDSSGSLNKKAPHGYDYITKSKRLAEDIQFVARSIGLACQVRPCQKSCPTSKGTFTGTYYRLCISGEDNNLLPTKEKRETRERKQIKRINVYGFCIEELGLGDYYGFTLDGNHLYMDGQFFVHHNSGKSTLLSALLNEIDPKERIITIEDTKELTCTLPNITHLYTYDRNVFSDVDAVRGALRMNPTRIIYGEVRDGRATLELIKAWNTGHKGGMCTIHANTSQNDYVGGVRTRLISLTNEVSSTAQIEAIDEVLEVVVQIEIQEGKRKVVNIENVKDKTSYSH